MKSTPTCKIGGTSFFAFTGHLILGCLRCLLCEDILYYGPHFPASQCKILQIFCKDWWTAMLFLSQGIITMVPAVSGIYSKLFTIPKAKEGTCPTLELKILNLFVLGSESPWLVIVSLHWWDFLTSVNIVDVYLHIPIFPFCYLHVSVNTKLPICVLTFWACPLHICSLPRC